MQIIRLIMQILLRTQTTIDYEYTNKHENTMKIKVYCIESLLKFGKLIKTVDFFRALSKKLLFFVNFIFHSFF